MGIEKNSWTFEDFTRANAMYVASLQPMLRRRHYATKAAAERAAVQDAKRHGESSYSVDASRAPVQPRGEAQRGEFRTDRGSFVYGRDAI